MGLMSVCVYQLLESARKTLHFFFSFKYSVWEGFTHRVPGASFYGAKAAGA
jgi:hypothetical protein